VYGRVGFKGFGVSEEGVPQNTVGQRNMGEFTSKEKIKLSGSLDGRKRGFS